MNLENSCTADCRCCDSSCSFSDCFLLDSLCRIDSFTEDAAQNRSNGIKSETKSFVTSKLFHRRCSALFMFRCFLLLPADSMRVERTVDLSATSNRICRECGAGFATIPWLPCCRWRDVPRYEGGKRFGNARDKTQAQLRPAVTRDKAVEAIDHVGALGYGVCHCALLHNG